MAALESEMSKWVEEYRRAGWNPIPCKYKTKTPVIKWKEYQKTKYAGAIHDEFNVGVVTGGVSGVWVIDLDHHDLLDELFPDKKDLVYTKTAKGHHVYYTIDPKDPPDPKKVNMSLEDERGRKIDTRHKGGYIMVPPSVHESGVKYEWVQFGKPPVVGWVQVLDMLKKKGFTTSTKDNTKPTVTGKQVPADEGKRHAALLVLGFGFANKMSEEERSFDTLLDQLLENNKIEKMEEYQTGEKRKELEGITKYILENLDENSVKLTFDFTTTKHNFAHIVDGDKKNHYNCHVYNEDIHVWLPTAEETILEDMKKLGDIEGFTCNSKTADETAKQIAVSGDTALQVFLNEGYFKQRGGMVIDPFGKYFDLSSGEVKEIDSSIHYFAAPDVLPELDANAPEANDWVEFLKERFGDDWEIVDDHFAGMFLHSGRPDDGPGALGSKPKLLHIVGKKNTWKSFTVELVAGLLDGSAVSNVSLRQLGADSVFGPATIVNKILNYHEEASPRMPDNQDTLKDIITKHGGSVRGMHSTKSKPARRWPRHVVACNKIAPIAEDDEDGAVILRYMYVETKENPAQQKDWGEILPAQRGIILMHLLKKAHNFTTNPETIHVQTEEQAHKKYKELRMGGLEKYITENFEGCGDDTGVGYIWLLNKYREHSKSHISKKTFNEILEELDLEKRAHVYSMQAGDGSLETYEACSFKEGVQRTLIMGIRSKIRKGDQKITE